MEGSEPRRASAKVLLKRRNWERVIIDIVRFVLGWFFIIVGAALILSGTLGVLYAATPFIFLAGEGPALEFFVGLLGVVVGGGVVQGMSRSPWPEARPPE